MAQKRQWFLGTNSIKVNTEWNKAEPSSICDQRDLLHENFYLQAKVSPLKIALCEILLTKLIGGGGLEYECPGWKIF